MAVPVVLEDDYVDVDELVAQYHRRKSTLILLIAAITFIFFGTISGYSAIQYSNAKLNTYEITVVEFAVVTAESEKCIENPEDPVCVKARDVIANPGSVRNDGAGLEVPIQVASIFKFGSSQGF